MLSVHVDLYFDIQTVIICSLFPADFKYQWTEKAVEKVAESKLVSITADTQKFLFKALNKER